MNWSKRVTMQGPSIDPRDAIEIILSSDAFMTSLGAPRGLQRSFDDAYRKAIGLGWSTNGYQALTYRKTTIQTNHRVTTGQAVQDEGPTGYVSPDGSIAYDRCASKH